MTSKRLARLVRLKKLAEEARATELAERRAALGVAEDDLARTRRAAETSDAALAVGASGAEVMALASYQEDLARQMQDQRAEIARRTEVVRDGEDAVREAWSSRRSLQSAQERAEAREDDAARAQERRELDELALNRRGRKH